MEVTLSSVLWHSGHPGYSPENQASRPLTQPTDICALGTPRPLRQPTNVIEKTCSFLLHHLWIPPLDVLFLIICWRFGALCSVPPESRGLGGEETEGETSWGSCWEVRSCNPAKWLGMQFHSPRGGPLSIHLIPGHKGVGGPS